MCDCVSTNNGGNNNIDVVKNQIKSLLLLIIYVDIANICGIFLSNWIPIGDIVSSVHILLDGK